MKQVEIRVINGNPICRFCEAETNYDDRGNWLIVRGKWKQYVFPPNAQIGKHILRLYDATVSALQFQNVLPENKTNPPYLPLVHSKKLTSFWQPEGFDMDWTRILQIVAKGIGDDELELYVTGSNRYRGRAEERLNLSAKKAEEHDKGVATKALRYPSIEHKVTGYKLALKQFGGKWEPGDHDAKEAFLKTFVDESYYARCDDEDPIYDKIVAVEWNITPKAAENEITKLRKAKLIK